MLITLFEHFKTKNYTFSIVNICLSVFLFFLGLESLSLDKMILINMFNLSLVLCWILLQNNFLKLHLELSFIAFLISLSYIFLPFTVNLVDQKQIFLVIYILANLNLFFLFFLNFKNL